MNKNKIAVFLFIFALIFPGLIFAETISLKSGKIIEGKIVTRTEKYVKVDVAGVAVPYFLDEIDKIDNEAVNVTTQPNAQGPAASETKIDTRLTTKSVELNSWQNVSEAIAQQQNGKHDIKIAFKDNPKAAKAAVALFGGMIIFFIIIGLIGYVYFSICLQYMAKKTNQELTWLAWVPIGQYFLMCKIAGLNYLWLLILLASIIPFIGWLAVSCFFMFLWYKIIIALKKPGWMVILLIVPIANLVLIGYLAFAKE